MPRAQQSLAGGNGDSRDVQGCPRDMQRCPRDVQGCPRDEGRTGTSPRAGGREWPQPGGQQEPARKGDDRRIYEHSHNESQLSVTTLNLVRERRRGTVSSGQAGRFNSTVPQHNHRMSPQCSGNLPVLPGLSHASERREGG